MYVKRRVFTEGKLKRPFFKTEWDENDHMVKGEDIYFSSNAKEAGYRIVSNASYACSHFHTIDLLALNDGFTDYFNIAFDILKRKYGDVGIQLADVEREIISEMEKQRGQQ
jgi:hypothetical protein